MMRSAERHTDPHRTRVTDHASLWLPWHIASINNTVSSYRDTYKYVICVSNDIDALSIYTWMSIDIKNNPKRPTSGTINRDYNLTVFNLHSSFHVANKKGIIDWDLAHTFNAKKVQAKHVKNVSLHKHQMWFVMLSFFPFSASWYELLP